MPENNQIQKISELIASLFSQGFKPEFEKFLSDKNIPFADQTDLYIRRLFNSVLNIPNIQVISYDFNGSDITVKLFGPFKSYANINGKDVNFDEDGIATVTLKNAKVYPQDGIFLNLFVQSTPYKSEKDTSLGFDTFSEEENIGDKVFDVAYDQEDRLYKFLESKKIYNDVTTNILQVDFIDNKIIIKNTAPFDVYSGNIKFEKNSKKELPLTIRNLVNSFLHNNIYNWNNKADDSFSMYPDGVNNAIANKISNTLDRTNNYDQDGIYFDKNVVLDYSSEVKNLGKILNFNGDKPIKFYVTENRYDGASLSSVGEITKEQLKDIVAIQQTGRMYINLIDSTGKTYTHTGGSGDGIIIFDVGE